MSSSNPPTGRPANSAFDTTLCVEDLRDAHLITFPTGYNLRTILEDWFHAAGCSPVVAAETGAIEVMLERQADEPERQGVDPDVRREMRDE